MVGHCCIVGCVNRTCRKKKEGVGFHCFPQDQALRKLWIQAIRRKNWEPNYHSRVCSIHFTSDVLSKNYKFGPRLRDGAVPSLFLEFEEVRKAQSSKKKRARNPYDLKQFDVVINRQERELADAALPHWEEYERRIGRYVFMPTPIVEVKEEPNDVMDITVHDLAQMAPLSRSSVGPLKSIPSKVDIPPDLNIQAIKSTPLTTALSPVTSANNPLLPTTFSSSSKVGPSKLIPSKVDVPPDLNIQPTKSNPLTTAFPPVTSANSPLLPTTFSSSSKVTLVENQLLPPPIMYRVIIPTSIEGHTIEPSSIMEQLKEKISALHLERVKNCASTRVSPQEAIPASIPKPQPTDIELAPSSTSKTLGNSSPLESNNPTVVKNCASTWVSLQEAIPTSISKPQPTDIELAPSSTSKTLGNTAPPKSNNLTVKDSTCAGQHAFSSKPKQHPGAILQQSPVVVSVPPPTTSVATSLSITRVSTTTSTTLLASTSSANQSNIQNLNPLTNSQVPTNGFIDTPVVPPKKIRKRNKTKKTKKKENREFPIGVSAIATGGTMKVVPILTENGSFMAFRALSVATQTDLAFEKLPKPVNEMAKEVKRCRSRLHKANIKLEKVTKELEEYECLKSLLIEKDRGQETVIAIEVVDKCECLSKRSDHEDMEDILRRGVNRRIPSAAVSRTRVLENAKIMKRIKIAKEKLKHKAITRVVVIQTEELS